MNLLSFVLVSYGLTQILVYGKIFDKVRPKEGWWGQLLSCSMCTGFWVGGFLWLINDFTTLFTFDRSVVTGVLLACLASGTSYMLDKIVDDDGFRFERRKEK